MLRSIKQFFDTHLRPEEGVGMDHDHRMRVATAALLIEITRADYDVKDAEREAVQDAVRRLFGDQSEHEARELIELAERQAVESTSLFQFTQQVDKHAPAEEKVRIVEMLWRVVFADGHKDANEEYLVRKISDLLHVSHRDFIRTRHIVEQDLGLSDG